MKPIRKVVAAALAALIIFAARKLHLSLGAKEADELAQVLTPLVLAYVIRDPRVDAKT